MGSSYGENVTQWSRGDYYRANNTENDLAIIAGFLDYRPDDHGSDNETATPLQVDSWSGSFLQEGVIETTGDPDVFSFATGSGTIQISASPYRASSGTWGGNLDILLELYDDGGSLLAANNPALTTDAGIELNVSAGSYYLHVKPVGVGNPMASTPTGYTSYASLGQYWISGMVYTDADDDGIPNAWEVQYFGGVTNAMPTDDADGDGSDNLTEYIAGYDPLDSNSVFKITSFTAPTAGGSPFIVTWNPVEGRLYSVQYGSDLKFSGFDAIPDAVDLPYTRSSYTDTVERVGSAHFYRVDVRLISP